MAAKGSQIIREHDELSQQVSALVGRKRQLEEQLEQRRQDIQEKKTAFATIVPRMEEARDNYRSASIERAEAQKKYDEIQGQCRPLIERRDEARKRDEKFLRPLKRKLDRAQRAYDRALERREQAKQRHDSAKGMEGFAAISAVADTVGSFGGEASTRPMRQLQRRVSQGNLTDASNVSAVRAMEFDEAEEAVILAQEDLEDATEEYQEQLDVLVESRREIDDAGDKAEALVNGLLVRMMNSDRVIARAERTIDMLDDLSQQTHLLEDAAKDEEELSTSLSETERELVSARTQLDAITDEATRARKRRGMRRTILAVLVMAAVVALAVCIDPLTSEDASSSGASTDLASTDEVASSGDGQTDGADASDSDSQSDDASAPAAVEETQSDTVDRQLKELNAIYDQLPELDRQISLAALAFNNNYLTGSVDQRREYATESQRVLEEVIGTWTPLQDMLRAGYYSQSPQVYDAAQLLDALCSDLYERANTIYSAWDLDARYTDPVFAKDDILGILESQNDSQGVNVYKKHYDENYPLWPSLINS